MRRTLVVLAGLASAATPSMADSDVEHARYTVVASDGPIEIREYAPQIVAETTVAGERDEAIREGFRRLAGFIFGANSPQQKIAMTAPVVQAPEGQKIAMTAPVDQTRVGSPGGGDAWSVRFTMPAEDFIAAKRLTPKGAAHYAFYDPPWTLPWNRRNEVMVEIGQT
jgi:hypothetical protein